MSLVWWVHWFAYVSICQEALRIHDKETTKLFSWESLAIRRGLLWKREAAEAFAYGSTPVCKKEKSTPAAPVENPVWLGISPTSPLVKTSRFGASEATECNLCEAGRSNSAVGANGEPRHGEENGPNCKGEGLRRKVFFFCSRVFFFFFFLIKQVFLMFNIVCKFFFYFRKSFFMVEEKFYLFCKVSVSCWFARSFFNLARSLFLGYFGEGVVLLTTFVLVVLFFWCVKNMSLIV